MSGSTISWITERMLPNTVHLLRDEILTWMCPWCFSPFPSQLNNQSLQSGPLPWDPMNCSTGPFQDLSFQASQKSYLIQGVHIETEDWATEGRKRGGGRNYVFPKLSTHLKCNIERYRQHSSWLQNEAIWNGIETRLDFPRPRTVTKESWMCNGRAERKTLMIPSEPLDLSMPEIHPQCDR